MAVVKERIILRKGRRQGEKMPHRVSLKELSEGDSLLVEIVIDRENDVVCRYQFQPEQLAGRRSVAFRASGDQVYWLGGVSPKPLLKTQADKLVPDVEHEEVVAPKRRSGKPGPRVRKVLVFDEYGKLAAIHRSLADVAAWSNLREKAIDKLCKSKRPSMETGYSFRYWWKVLGFDITDFSLTASQYDELCKRKPEED